MVEEARGGVVTSEQSVDSVRGRRVPEATDPEVDVRPVLSYPPLSENGLRVLSVLADGPQSAVSLGERLNLTRQGVHKIIGRLRERGYVSEREAGKTYRYSLQRRPILREYVVEERPIRSRVRTCIVFEPARRSES